jgi:hypothetical protein
VLSGNFIVKEILFRMFLAGRVQRSIVGATRF